MTGTGAWCTTASCLAHKRRVFVQLWPPSVALRWLHTDLSFCDGLPDPEDMTVTIPDGDEGRGPGWALPKMPA